MTCDMNREAEDGRGLLGRHAAEEAHFDELRQTGLAPGKAVQRHVKIGERVRPVRYGCGVSGGQGRELALSALLSRAGPGVVNQDLAHDSRGGREKVCARVETQILTAHQTKKGFVNERGGLERMFGALDSHLRGGDTAKLLVHHRNQGLQGIPVSLP